MNKNIIAMDFSPAGLALAVPFKQKSELSHLSQSFFVDEPFVRNFAVSATDVFLSAQKQYKESYPDPVSQQTVTSLSQMYRGLILELCSNLKEAGDMVAADLYTNLDFVWNFCEIMFLSSHPDFPVLPYLVDWIKINFDMTSEILPELLNELPDLEPENMNNLWSLIYSHVFHGATDDASRLLPYTKTQHGNASMSSAQDRKLNLMNELLVKKPSYDPSVSSLTDFEALWTAWKEECKNRLDQRVFFGDEHLTFICKILCGDEEAFKEAASKNLLTWYEYLVMKLNYQYPTVQPSALKGFAKSTLEELNLVNSLEARDMILLHAMESDIINVLKEIQSAWDNPWFALHFSDLVVAGGKFLSVENPSIDYSSVAPLRDSFILEYGSTLMEHTTLWQMGVYYLEGLPENMGRSIIRECIQRKKPKTEDEAQKLLQIAEKFSFGREIYGICRQVALQKLSRGQMQNALLWAIKAGDGPLTTHIVDSILFEGDCQIEPSLLESLRQVIPCADRLLFLSGFCDFRKFMEKRDYRQAVTQLCYLVKNDLIPKRISHKILLNLHELSENKVKLEGGETSILMEFLHTKVGSDKLSEEEFDKLNSILMCNRAQDILDVFKEFNQKRFLTRETGMVQL